jgi:hypothetical protein
MHKFNKPVALYAYLINVILSLAVTIAAIARSSYALSVLFFWLGICIIFRSIWAITTGYHVPWTNTKNASFFYRSKGKWEIDSVKHYSSKPLRFVDGLAGLVLGVFLIYLGQASL